MAHAKSALLDEQVNKSKKRRRKLCQLPLTIEDDADQRTRTLLDRILTFSECRSKNLRATCFAYAGFSFIAEPDTVGCDSCGLILSEFKDNRLDPLVLHQTFRPDCRSVREISSESGDGEAPSETVAISDISTTPEALMTLTFTTSILGSMIINGEDAASNDGHTLECYEKLHKLRRMELMNRERSKHSMNRERSKHSEQTSRRSDMMYETSRRDTFTNHSIPDNLWVARLAEKGFYFWHSEDSSMQIRCAFCELNISITEGIKSQNDVDKCHYSLKPHCPFLRGEKTKNIPDIYGEAMWKSSETAEVTSNLLSDLGVSNTFAKHPLLSVSDNRSSTYLTFPHTYGSNVDTDRLVEAGYFYEGCKDSVTCFYCGCKSSDWSISEDPWKRHARTSSKCQHVISSKGINFIREAIEALGEYIPPRQQNVINVLSDQLMMPQKSVEIPHTEEIPRYQSLFCLTKSASKTTTHHHRKCVCKQCSNEVTVV